MALKSILEKLEDAHEANREHYRQAEDGKYVLDVTEDHPLKRKVGELHEQRKALRAQLEEITKRYEGFDLEEHKRLRADLDEIKSGKGETFQSIVGKHKASLQEEYGRKLSETAKARDEAKRAADTYRSGLARRLLADEFRRVLSKEKIKLSSEGAFEDLMGRAAGYFEADPDSGKVRAREADSVDEVKSAAEWLRERLRDASDAHLFESGASGAGNGGVPGRRAGNGKVYLSRRQISQPNEEEFKTILSGNYEVTD